MNYSVKQYKQELKKLLTDKTINQPNRELWKQFFKEQEYKLKRQNSIAELDQGTLKTLKSYIYRFKNINKWFKNKPWTNLSKKDIKQVYDGLEDGKIKNYKGKPFKDKASYYNKIMKSRPFQMAGKDILAKEVIRYSGKKDQEVRFFRFDVFENILSVVNKIEYKALLWLAWDIGENINSLLQLKKKDFKLNYDHERKEQEYIVNLHKDILKRTRQQRGEPTLYPETFRLLQKVLEKKEENDRVFPFEYNAVRMLLHRATKKTKAVCEPNGEAITWKDFRSSMACHLLMNHWNREELNARLGHKPSSTVIDRYINHLAIDRNKPKRRMYENNLQDLKTQVDALSRKDKAKSEELASTRAMFNLLVEELQKQKEFSELKEKIIKAKKQIQL